MQVDWGYWFVHISLFVFMVCCGFITWYNLVGKYDAEDTYQRQTQVEKKARQETEESMRRMWWHW
jgi:uncharacterized protein YxeA